MARWFGRIAALLAPLAAAGALLVVLGVVASDVPATAERAHERALGLAVELRSLAGRTVDLGRTVQLGGDDRRDELRAIADRAHRIEYDVRQLHRSETSRGELRRAALAAAEAAAVLARWQPGETDRSRRARRAVRRTERALAEAADELADTATPRELARVHARLPAVLIAGPVQP